MDGHAVAGCSVVGPWSCPLSTADTRGAGAVFVDTALETLSECNKRLGDKVKAQRAGIDHCDTILPWRGQLGHSDDYIGRDFSSQPAHTRGFTRVHHMELCLKFLQYHICDAEYGRKGKFLPQPQPKDPKWPQRAC